MFSIVCLSTWTFVLQQSLFGSETLGIRTNRNPTTESITDAVYPIKVSTDYTPSYAIAANTERIHKVVWNIENYGEVYAQRELMVSPLTSKGQFIEWWNEQNGATVAVRLETIYRGINDVKEQAIDPDDPGGGS
ncbi:MAG: hypothetical protein JSS71_01240 [Armatimonadetes bacterium]|nr:hypothetical protein [Armatimonadota bacterium]MBX3109032.1 hypothetical protein [Fimbriimonadaceae bacterium]